MAKFEDTEKIIVEKKKAKPSSNMSRINRCFIARNECSSQDIDLSRDDCSEINGASI